MPFFFLTLLACSPPVPDKNPPDVVGPEQPFCDPDQKPKEQINIRYLWVPESRLHEGAFVEACAYFKDFGVTCTKVIPGNMFDLFVANSSYFYCNQNAMIDAPDKWHPYYSLIINNTCMPQNSEAYAWQREVFAKKIGELLGVGGYPGFCGAGNFANYVDSWWFRAPYDGQLTASDELAWYHRDRSLSASGSKETGPYCGPDTDAVPPVCATPTDVDDSFVMRIYAAPDIWEEALFACNMWTVFGVTCLSSDEESADIIVTKNGADDCTKPGKTEFSLVSFRWVISISGCLDGMDAAMRVSHQIGHVFGLPHIPVWCAAGIMNNIPGAECLTWADYGIWHERLPDLYSSYE